MKVTSTSFIKTFELELIRWIKYLLKFGLFVYRDNTFQTEDIDFIFSYLWHILDIYTGRNYVKSYKNLEKLIIKDVMVDSSKIDSFSRVQNDIKYRLFNKNYGMDIIMIRNWTLSK